MTCWEFLEASGLSCSEYFCPTCEAAHTCDRACGYCSSVPPPPRQVRVDEEGKGKEGEEDAGQGAGGDGQCEEGVVDCDGACLLPVHCGYDALGYLGCEDWLGNGVCDDGRGYVSDAGVRPNFNCKSFGCDGGDCGSEEVRGRRWSVWTVATAMMQNIIRLPHHCTLHNLNFLDLDLPNLSASVSCLRSARGLERGLVRTFRSLREPAPVPRRPAMRPCQRGA